MATPEPTPVFGREPTGPVQVATVASVTDGDTIRVLLDGQNVPVRYIGIDTPETQAGSEWMGQEATDANAQLVAGREVVLEMDVSETDQYGRLLRHVWIETDAGWTLVSLELLRLGVAEVTTFPPDVKYVDELFLPAQREAAIGLWGTPPTAAVTPAPIAPLVPGNNCEPSYPDVCIPIGSADLDCPDIDARRFTVLWEVANPDPHRFDGDADGIGCES
jgi:micrococcal nuclease